MNLTPLGRDNEFRLFKKLNDIEIGLYKVKNSLILWGVSFGLIFTGLEVLSYKLFH